MTISFGLMCQRRIGGSTPRIHVLFKVVENRGSESKAPAGATRHKLSPVKIMQYFGLERCIKHLHSLPEWNKARGQMCRDVNQTICTSFFGTKASKLLNERLGHSLHQPHIGIYEIGTDWFSFFSDKRKRCTTGVFF